MCVPKENMAKKMLIDATHAEETRVVVVDGNKVEEFDFESENKRQLAGNIYLAKVTRVEPSLQAAFVEYGGNRHGFLAFSEIHPDYYQIPVADREALLAEEMAYAQAQAAEEDEEKPKKRRSRGGRGRSKAKAEAAKSDDAVETREISGMDVVDLDDPDAEVAPEADPAAEATPAPDETTEAAAPDADVQSEGEGAEASGDQDASDEAEDGQDASAKDDGRMDASEKDDSIESVADEDVAEEIRPARRQKPRKYKIQEVIKVRQILLVQVVKEERGNKGAALTTYLSLAGRYCVLMPNTARGGGISRKITNAADRKKLKEIAGEIDVPKGAGLIIRTAGAKRTKTEVKRDYEYLQRLWEQIRELTLQSIAPAKIYEEGDLIKRSIRDLYNREIDEVLVEGENGYRTAKDFMKMIMPSHAKNVQLYTDAMPLFARYQVESYLAGMFNPTVQLKSGGYIVIGVTEALVAVDVNSGRATKEGSIEETALKTNLEASEEVARQLRLRDLAGLIVIDYIDMEERKNNAAVEKRLKDRLKTDRARIQVGRISGFGLLEMSRQRLRPGMIEISTQPCHACHGTGLVRSDDSLGLTILRQIEEEGTRRKAREVLVKAPMSIVNFLMNQKREHIAQIEARYGMSVRIEADPFLVSPEFTLEKFKTATRRVAEVKPAAVSADAILMDPIEDEDIAEAEVSEAAEETAEAAPKKKRRRRRRRRGGGGAEGHSGEGQSADGQNAEGQTADGEARADQAADGSEAPASEVETRAGADAVGKAPEAEAEEAAKEAKPKRTRSRSSRSSRAKKADADEAPADVAVEEVAAQSTPAEAEVAEEAVAEEPKPKPKRKRAPAKKKVAETPPPAEEPAPEVAAVASNGADMPAEPEPVTPELETASAASAPEPEEKPRRRGWWRSR
jgi:ribonuclease E